MESDQQTAALLAALDLQDKPTIRAAVDQLIGLAAKSPRLRETLDQRLAKTGQPNSWPVAYVLGNLPNPSRAAIAALLEALDHRDPDIRWAIALLLVRIAKEREDLALMNSLLQLCAAGTDNQKRMALYVIRDLALADAASLAALLAALRDAEPTVRVAAAICLKPRSDVDDAGKALLLELYLHDAEPRVRHAVAITLAALGAPAADFLLALKKNSASENEQTKKAAIAALELLRKRRSAPGGSASDR